MSFLESQNLALTFSKFSLPHQSPSCSALVYASKSVIGQELAKLRAQKMTKSWPTISGKKSEKGAQTQTFGSGYLPMLWGSST